MVKDTSTMKSKYNLDIYDAVRELHGILTEYPNNDEKIMPSLRTVLIKFCGDFIVNKRGTVNLWSLITDRCTMCDFMANINKNDKAQIVDSLMLRIVSFIKLMGMIIMLIDVVPYPLLAIEQR